ncbi:MAG: putative secreted protein [Streptosporangiaceae bacterium]|jgi:uncharacterized membrane protein|nr:putative secreted protein [Streptosporangiaceae bacterium]
MAVFSLRNAGVLLAATGAAHFAVPKRFEAVTALAFPENTGQWVYRNGATELALGLALAVPRTRKLGAAGVAAYTAWLGTRARAGR